MGLEHGWTVALTQPRQNELKSRRYSSNHSIKVMSSPIHRVCGLNKNSDYHDLDQSKFKVEPHLFFMHVEFLTLFAIEFCFQHAVHICNERISFLQLKMKALLKQSHYKYHILHAISMVEKYFASISWYFASFHCFL